MILVIDNYDSFVHNLARYFEQLGCETFVVRNDALDLDWVAQHPPQAIVISPGPCTPDTAGCSLEVVRRFGDSIPILGVCLGHQAIVQALGGKISLANEPIHGRPSQVNHFDSNMFVGIDSPFKAGRYHSLVARTTDLPPQLRVTAATDNGTVMAVEHETWPLVGLQFHPESILTDCGYQLLKNFLTIANIEFDGGQLSDSPLGTWSGSVDSLQLPIRSPRLSTRTDALDPLTEPSSTASTHDRLP
ncbi:MAG: anthranilate synthase/aminodeoxychorismate synthase-like glutamine amidotransferase [Mariniblastus sp.]|jgi:anthranilate synthase/aminodeoxychorismate synthase-like glutamine amidotransferase